MSNVDIARQFSEAAPAGQTRKGACNEPYISHVAEVATLVAGFGGSDAQGYGGVGVRVAGGNCSAVRGRGGRVVRRAVLETNGKISVVGK